MKNRGLIIFLIIMLSVLAIIITMGMIWLLNGKNNFSWVNFKSSSVSDELVFDETYDHVFEDIKIISDAGDVYIKEGTADEVVVNIYGDTKRLNVNDQDHLEINYIAKKCIGFCFNVEASKIEVYIPTDYNGQINIENKYGETHIEEFENAKIEIVNDYGDIRIDAVKEGKIINRCGDIEIGTILNVEVENNLGDIEIGKVLSSLDIDADCGDIEIKQLNIETNSVIKNSMGDVEIGSTNDIRINAHTSLGEVDVRHNDYKSDIVLNIDNSCGDITVKN